MTTKEATISNYKVWVRWMTALTAIFLLVLAVLVTTFLLAVLSID
ncbi:MAG TPA: hypothetical protein VGP65_11625 [Candidatus Angelobacter sp.]|nr:hypothetical protein [Candidatus Angelobacter sp.]HEV7552327.1 hypothetical protein [Candidatus Angelobacter sp.]